MNHFKAKNGEQFLEILPQIKNTDVCVCFGDEFYISLFLNYNLPDCYYVVKNGKADNYYARNGKLLQNLEQIDTGKSRLYYIYCNHAKKTNTEIENAYHFFDQKEIVETGTFVYQNNRYIVDDIQWIESCPKYMSLPYGGKATEKYMKELSSEPSGMVIAKDGGIGLHNFNGNYIHHREHKRVTDCQYDSGHYKHVVHVYGDSRVSGYMVEDGELFTNRLQQKLDLDGGTYRIINYGIPGREIERMKYQVRHSKLRPGDLVIVLTACHEYRNDALERQYAYAMHLKGIKQYCRRKKSQLIYINLPTSMEMKPETEFEKTLNQLYRNYKFGEYTDQTVEKYKLWLMALLMENGIICYDMENVFRENHGPDELFINMHHYSPAGNQIIADFLYRIICSETLKADANAARTCFLKQDANLKKNVKKMKEAKSHFQIMQKQIGGWKQLRSEQGRFKLKYYLSSYTRTRRRQTGKKIDGKAPIIGSIVMNANPFTRGHRYLVEMALREVDFLYVFVLEEDKSSFGFRDRLEMVKQGTIDLKQVLVLPSGPDIISSVTFPEYFRKDELQETTIDATRDIRRFALNIAPHYKIKVRFIGEEPIDKVTRQYNEQLLDKLPQYNIQCREIPRLKEDENAICASYVRKLISEKKYEELDKYVPETTRNYIIEHKSCMRE